MRLPPGSLVYPDRLVSFGSVVALEKSFSELCYAADIQERRFWFGFLGASLPLLDDIEPKYFKSFRAAATCGAKTPNTSKGVSLSPLLSSVLDKRSILPKDNSDAGLLAKTYPENALVGSTNKKTDKIIVYTNDTWKRFDRITVPLGDRENLWDRNS